MPHGSPLNPADPILGAITIGALQATLSVRGAYSGIPPSVPDQINLGLRSTAGIGLSQRETQAQNLVALTPERGVFNLNPYTGKIDRGMQTLFTEQVAKLEKTLPRNWFVEIMARYEQLLAERSNRLNIEQRAIVAPDEEIEAESMAASFSLGLISDPAFAVNGGAPTSGPTQTNALGQTISNYSGRQAFTAENGVITMTGRADGGNTGNGATPGAGQSSAPDGQAP